MKAFFWMICFFLIVLNVKAQDTIFRVNGIKTIAKILAVDLNIVHYRPFGDTAAYEFILDKRSVDKIVYADGRAETFDHKVLAQPDQPGLPIESALPHDTRNQVDLNVSDVGFSLFSVEYTRFMPSGNFAFKVPLTIGFGSVKNDRVYEHSHFINKQFGAGAGFYFYPPTNTWLGYDAGLAIEFGKFYDVSNSYETIEKQWFNSQLIYLGAYAIVGSSFVISVNIGGGRGAVNYDYSSTYNSYNSRSKDYFLDYRAWIALGLKF